MSSRSCTTERGARSARVRALAKLNLGLRVLHQRADGYHELRTVFQTISLADELEIEFTPSRRTSVALSSNLDIPDNIAVRAARLTMDAMRATGAVRMRLKKRIPPGGGLGGGSSDAAAVLLALPALAARRLELEERLKLAADLGSDVPFFLLGGTAVGLGRGTELYPLPDLPPRHVLVVTPNRHVSTAEAYRKLRRKLTNGLSFQYISSFQSGVWRLDAKLLAADAAGSCDNDFEGVVFGLHPQLRSIQRKLASLGANPARLTGSGASLFGVFATRAEARRAAGALAGERVFAVSLVGRRHYRRLWWSQLAEHVEQTEWPPQSRYAR